jgi:fatty acid/phospholipid biosynthesis enzyme
MDPNEYWGAPLLGVNNLAVILHGATSPRGIETALLGTRVAVESDIIEHIRQNITNLRQSELPRANETAPENSETPPAAIETLGN